MTPQRSSLRIIGLTALGTAALFVGMLALQQWRGGWPFQAVVPAATTSAPEQASDDAAPLHDRVPVNVAESAVEQLGIRLDAVREERLESSINAVAIVVPDESRLAHAHTRVEGWVEQLEVNTTGEFVRAGQPLARIFSQELLSSQTEYLAARRNAASGIASAVVASGRTRLGVLGMSEAEIAAIERAGEPMRLVTVLAPRTGVVVHRGISVGTAVDPSTELLTIADLSRVWLLAEVPESDIPSVRVGSSARLEFPASGLDAFTGRVDFVYPTITERTRTLRVRLAAGNPRGALKPGMYGTASFAVPGRNTLTVPRDAVVDTGAEQHVFVAASGSFEPRPVTIGTRLADRVEIIDGLKAGEQVVAAGVFLLDSESRLRATGGAASHAHGQSAPAADEEPKPLTGHAGH